MNRVLLVDDDPFALETLSEALTSSGVQAVGVSDPSAALGMLSSERFELLITDILMEPIDGFDLLDAARRATPRVAGVVVTGHPSLEGAVTAMRKGAVDYFAKPFHVDELVESVRSALAGRRAEMRVGTPRAVFADPSQILLGESEAASSLRERVERVAAADCPVLISGREGSGREEVARAIHRLGERSAAPLVVVDCDADTDLPALARRLDSAHEGTAYLVGVDRLSACLRRRLAGFVRRGTHLEPASHRAPDARILSSVTAPIEALVAGGELEPELADELSVVTVPVPSLSERAADLPALIHAFAASVAERAGLTPPRFEDGAIGRLVKRHGRGTLRRLALAVEGAVILSGERPVSASRLEQESSARVPQDDASAAISLESLELVEVERRVVALALDRTSWNIKRAAERLGITRATLYSKIKRYSLRETATTG